jgi:hypothetical protein
MRSLKSNQYFIAKDSKNKISALIAMLANMKITKK